MKMLNIARLSTMLVASALLVACGSDDDGSVVTYEVSVSNLTHNQPLSPVGVLLHSDQYQGWQVGSSASLALEELAEGGANDTFIALDDDSKLASMSGTGLILSGASEAIEISVDAEQTNVQLTVATMLVNTNDAFTGRTGVDLSELEMGGSLSFRLPVYDAGTELNDEQTSTIPGQGGTGFVADRNDLDKVARHPGVTGTDEIVDEPRLLNSTHRFDGPVATLTITRLN